jgi:glycosyltransferase involved in cell wall biosynthesis
MTTSPAISVIVPFFNNERHIGACLQALLAQEGVDDAYEVILVDNGSTDASAAIASSYDGITLLEELSPGAYAARNAGLRRASAPLIAFTDADCVVDADWLRSIQTTMADPRIGIMVGHCRYPASASWALRLLGAYENAKTEYVINRCGPEQYFAYANNMAVRASLFDELGPFENWRRAADSELVHRMASQRPDLRLIYNGSMRMTHLEFLSARARIRRLLLYARTNSRISGFRELGAGKRLGVLLHLLRRR